MVRRGDLAPHACGRTRRAIGCDDSADRAKPSGWIFRDFGAAFNMSGLAIKTNGHGIRLNWPEHRLFCTLDRFQDRGGVSKAELSAYLVRRPPRLLTQGSL